jgi:hypothetical protein
MCEEDDPDIVAFRADPSDKLPGAAGVDPKRARAADEHTWAMACGAPIGALSMCERTQKPSLSPAECPEDALIYVRRVSIIAEDRLILIGS